MDEIVEFPRMTSTESNRARGVMVSASSIRAAADSATFDLAGQDVSSILYDDSLHASPSASCRTKHAHQIQNLLFFN